jgi:3'-5' exoribonuclease
MPTLELGPAGSLTAPDSTAGHGIYLLAATVAHIGPSGQERLTLTLEDKTGHITGVVWPDAIAAIKFPAVLPAPVRVHAIVQHYDGNRQLKVQALTGVDHAEVARATQLLPRYLCPQIARPAFDQLAALEQALPPPLNGFLREVLLDPTIGLPFLSCRGSVAHHHGCPSGLLVHCTEMLDLAFNVTRRIIPDDAWSPFIAQMSYLFHDLGKLRSVGTTCRARNALVVRHELLTVELLAPHLHWLEAREPDLAAGLRYVLGYLATPAAARKPADYVVAHIVAMLDQWSAGAFNHCDLDHLINGWRQRPVVTRDLPHREASRQQPAARFG